jgi:hypothetical protein
VTLAQTNAVVARIQSIPALASKTYKLVAPRDATGKLPTAPYCVVQPDDGVDTQERVTGPRSTSHPRFVVHVVGTSYDNAQTVLELVKAKFVVAGRGVVLNVPDEVSKPCRWDSVGPVQVDNDVSPPLVYASAEVSWISDRI